MEIKIFLSQISMGGQEGWGYKELLGDMEKLRCDSG